MVDEEGVSVLMLPWRCSLADVVARPRRFCELRTVLYPINFDRRLYSVVLGGGSTRLSMGGFFFVLLRNLAVIIYSTTLL